MNKTTTANSFGLIQVGIILTTLVTALIHFSLLFPNPMFILNSLGYLALLALYFLPIPALVKNRGLIRWAYIAYAIVTIIAWLYLAVIRNGDISTIGLVAKADEVLLIILLWLDGRK